MIAPRIVRYAQVARTSWKNGLGSTRQLAVHPQCANAESFEWRLSIAELTHTAAFSRFAGVERCLVVLEGAMTLQREGAAALALSPLSPPVFFSGEMAARGVVERATVLDLNLMWQPALWQANLTRLTASRAVAELPRGGTLMLCALANALQLQLDTVPLLLGRYDLLLLDAAAGPLSAVAAADFDAYLIELQPR